MKLKVNHLANIYEKYWRDLYLSFEQLEEYQMGQIDDFSDASKYALSGISVAMKEKDDFLSMVKREIAEKTSAIAKMQELYSADKMIWKDPDETKTEPVDLDRPTLADRLDKAEERIKELEKVEKAFEAYKRNAEASYQVAAKERDNWKGRAERAEAMAQKVDAVMVDLHKCRDALGTVAFEKVIGPTWQTYMPTGSGLVAEDLDLRFHQFAKDIRGEFHEFRRDLARSGADKFRW